MEQHLHTVSPEVSVVHPHDPGTKRIWRTFWLLLGITLVELLLGLSMYWFPNMKEWLHIAVKGVIVILSLAKAFYIVSIFMHLGDEVRNLIMTIVVPLMLFIWFIGAFLWDGNSWKNYRNMHDRYKNESSTRKAEKKEQGEGQKPG